MFCRTDSGPLLVPPTDSGIVELSLLLSSGQFDALEQRARLDGVSVAQFLRRLVRQAVCEDDALETVQ